MYPLPLNQIEKHPSMMENNCGYLFSLSSLQKNLIIEELFEVLNSPVWCVRIDSKVIIFVYMDIDY